MNLPVNDSIQNIINGEFGYTFQKENYDTQVGDYTRNIDLYYTEFSNHSYFKETPGALVIVKTRFKDSTITYDITFSFAFPTKENQMYGYNLIKEKFNKYSERINSSEIKSTKSSKVLGYETEIEFENYKFRLSAFTANKKQAHQVRIDYKLHQK
jgi:hypothetical protein